MIFIWLGISASSVTAIASGTILPPMPRCVALGSTKFWTPHLSDSDDGLANLIRDDWLSDTRPPTFNAWATVLSSLGVTSIAAGRIASNLPVAGLMVLATLQFAQRLPDQESFNSALLLPTLSLPPAMEAFVTCRSYFWQMAARPLPISAHHSTCQQSELLKGLKAPYPKASHRFTLPKSPIRVPRRGSVLKSGRRR